MTRAAQCGRAARQSGGGPAIQPGATATRPGPAVSRPGRRGPGQPGRRDRAGRHGPGGSPAGLDLDPVGRAQLKPEPHERLADWTARCVQQLGDLVFAVEDQEAAWHAWNVEQRFAGLGRLYRDQRFDALVSCPRCHRVSTVTGSTVCKQCSATDRLVRT